MKRDKCIAFYCSSLSWGGLEMNLVNRAKWFNEAGYDLTFYSVKNAPITKHLITCKINQADVNRPKKYLAIKSGYKLFRYLKKSNISRLVISDNRDMSTIAWAKFFSYGKIKTVYIQQMMLGVPKKDIIHTLRFKQIDYWISCLPYLKKQLLIWTKIKAEKIHVIPLSVEIDNILSSMTEDEAREQLKLPKNKTLIGVIGRIDPQKGQLQVLEAYSQITDLYPDVELVFMGESTKNEGKEYMNSIISLINEKKLQTKVHIIGFDNRVSLFYKAINVFVLSSKGETYGMVTVEAMVNGKTIIATNSGGTPDLLENGKWGRLYEPGNVGQLHTQLEKILSDISQTKESELLKKYAAERFNHKKELQALIEIVQNS